MTTLNDIAKIAGVNKSTVSRALDGIGRISEQKRKDIVRIADSLGYVPDLSAQVLAGKNARTIGIILPEIDCNYYASVVGAIETRLKERGYSLIIGQTGFQFENELHALRLMVQKKVDGILFDLYNTDQFLEKSDEIQQHIKVPVVFIESSLRLPAYDAIEIDNKVGVELGIELLAHTGHRRIGFISEFLSSKCRLPAFIAAMGKFNLPVDQNLIKIGCERMENGGYLRMMELVSQGSLPDAVFASYDTMAHGAMKALAEHGIDVPGDLSIVGFDNVRESAFYAVPLTTVEPPVMEMSKMAVQMLLERIEKKVIPAARHLMMNPRLVVRNSARMPRIP